MDDDQREILKVGAETALRPITDIIDKLLGGPAEQIGGMWTDALAARRQIRRIALSNKIQAAIDKAGFNPQRIPDKISIPALREAFLEDDETVQEIWANLLANAADPRQLNPVLPSFSSMLKELTAREARFLDLLHTNKLDDLRRSQLDIGYTRDDLLTIYGKAGLSRRPRLSNLTVGEVAEGGDDLHADFESFAAMTGILVRNGILNESAEPNPIDVSKFASNLAPISMPRSIEVTATTRYRITELGAQFIKACQAPSK
jgi:hypothetical protein